MSDFYHKVYKHLKYYKVDEGMSDQNVCTLIMDDFRDDLFIFGNEQIHKDFSLAVYDFKIDYGLNLLTSLENHIKMYLYL